MKLPDALFTGLYGLGLVEAACLGIGQAVDIAVQDVLEDFEIREFLIGHRAEVKDLCITEYNEAETMQMIREEGPVDIGAFLRFQEGSLNLPPSCDTIWT